MSSPFRTLPAFLSLPLLFVLSLLPATAPALGQSPVPQTDRIAANADLRSTTRLSGHIPAWAVAANDAGPAPASDTLRLTLVLSRSAERQAAFNQLLADQQNPSSPSFHHWLTPQQIGALYGPTQNDLDALTAWLTGQGFQVRETAPSGLFLTAEAPVSTISNAFAVNLRSFSLRDPATGTTTTHIATTAEPAIPSAFASVVSAIKGLSDAPVRPMHHTRLQTNANDGAVSPRVSFTNGAHLITPNDFATIYGINPTYQSGITGANQKVAIVGRSRVDSTDITNFETMTGLTAKQPNIIVPPTGVDPGVTNTGDQGEATLDVERVFGTAPGAQVDLVVSKNSTTSNGVEIAAQYEVETLRDPILSISFGSCEADAGSSTVNYWDSLFSQAAGEGISVFVSSGDAGVDGCETGGPVPATTQTASINAICASSYATCVGGTEFADFANPSAYWLSSNGTGFESAIGYIPEGAWNEPTTTTSGSTTVSNLSATGGGASTIIAKPTWQTGTGVPADAARDVPDVSFSAAMHDGYLSCLSYANSDCTTKFTIFSGTSAAAPSMAGIAALLDQKAGAQQGNLNPLLYRLAASTTGGFQDVTPATSGVALCELNTPSMCNNSIPGPTVGSLGLAGYAVTTGYDLATGLGSLQVSDFLTAATAPVTPPTPPPTNVPSSIGLGENTTPMISANSATINTSQAVSFIAGVVGNNSGPLTGTVTFYSNGTQLGSPVTVQQGNATSPPQSFPTVGTYTITATYSGNSTYASSSTSLKLVVTTAPTATTVTIVTLASPNIPAGGSDALTAVVRATTGSGPVPTGYVEFTAGGTTFAGPYQLMNGSVATASAIALLPAGTTQITATYLGDSNYLGSTSAPQTLTINAVEQTTTVVLTPQYTTTTVAAGITETFTASVNGNVTHSPTGTVQFFEGSTSLATVSLVNGTATTSPIPFNTAGTFQMRAVYSGDANFLSATSAAVPITVTTGAPYQLIAAPASITVMAGSTAENGTNIDIQQTSAFVGNITLACTVAYNGTGTANDMPTCAFQGNNFPIPGISASSQLTITTVAHQATTAANRVSQSAEHPFSRWGGISLCSLLLCLFGPRRLRRARHAIGVGALFALFVMASGCGGASSGTTAPSSTPAATGTTAGSYTVTVTSTNTAGVPTPVPLTIALTVN